MNVKEQAIRNLLDFKKVTDGLKIPMCLQAGTLLGVYRNGDFIEGDEGDVDVAILEHDYWRINEVSRVLAKVGFIKFKVFQVENKIESVGFERGASHLDVFSMHVRESKAFNLGRSWGKHGLPSVFAYVYPAQCFKRFDSLQFQGEKFNIPSCVELYLSVRYANWRVPVLPQEFDYLDIKQSPCVDGSDWWKGEWHNQYHRYPDYQPEVEGG